MHFIHSPLLLLLLLFTLLPCYSAHSCNSESSWLRDEAPPQEYIDPTFPPAFPTETPVCSLLLLQHDFNGTLGLPAATANYTPPHHCRWNRAVLELSVFCAGHQDGRIAAVWVNGAEVLRTSTAESTDSGVFWKVRKDVTRYSSLLRRTDKHRQGLRDHHKKPVAVVSVMLENAVDGVYAGVFHVNVSLDFYGGGKLALGLELSADEFGISDEEEDDLDHKLGFSTKKSGGKRSAVGNVRKLGLGLSTNELGISDGGEDDLYHKLGFFNQKNGGEHSRAGNVGKLGLRLGLSKDEFGASDGGGDDLHHKLGFFSKKIGGKVRSSALSRETINNLYGKPADLIIPISKEKGDNGYWFRIESESNLQTKSIKIPRNAYRAILEIYSSAHSDDEFWYSNPPTSYLEQNNLPTRRGNGAFRQVIVTIDGLYAGSVVPFPAVYTGGINPLFWKPVVSIGTFELPSYDIDLTPFLGNLLDGKKHEFGLGVTDSLPFWLVDANLHLWLDPHSNSLKAKLVLYKAPPISITHTNKGNLLEGKFHIEAERGSHFSGWVKSSLGNLTTLMQHQAKFRSSVEFKNNGDVKEVYTKAKFKTDIKTEEGPKLQLFRQYHKAKYPIRLVISTSPGEDGSDILRTNISHVMYEKTLLTVDQVPYLSSISDSQRAGGWVEMQGNSVVSGSASSLQTYAHTDQSGCFSRTVSAEDGAIMSDQASIGCTSGLIGSLSQKTL